MSPEGYNFDLYVSNADVNAYDLAAIRVPTLIVHTKDDQLASHDASERAAKRIPGARFVSLESGGHLMIGQTRIVRDELARFFAERPDRGVERAVFGRPRRPGRKNSARTSAIRFAFRSASPRHDRDDEGAATGAEV